MCLVSEFLGSGSGSTVACVEWTLAHLVDRPEVQDKLRREIDGTDGGAVTIKSLRRGMPYLNAVVLLRIADTHAWCCHIYFQRVSQSV